ncbi:MAG: 1-deoxy-D-xylulose-5-phosphate reductoisomerase, partial [Muribaculaceae bacterium]|nr:1-deoxy-D-xylulose-5-phosphate reductoisomerase [Muribaculaceae bacterium]
GNMPCILNAANEVAVEAFLNRRIGFLDMGVVARKTMDRTPFQPTPDLESLISTHEEATCKAREILDILTLTPSFKK